MTQIFVYINYGITALALLAFLILVIVKLGDKSKHTVKFCHGISKFIKKSKIINDDNLPEFEERCLNNKTPTEFSKGWNEFKIVKYGYPSKFYDKDKLIKSNNRIIMKFSWIFFGVIFWLDLALISVSYFVKYQIIYGYALVLVPLFMLLLNLINPTKKAKNAIDKMSVDLDTAVRIQYYKNLQLDTSGLENCIDEIKNIIEFEKIKPSLSENSRGFDKYTDDIKFQNKTYSETKTEEETPFEKALKEYDLKRRSIGNPYETEIKDDNLKDTISNDIENDNAETEIMEDTKNVNLDEAEITEKETENNENMENQNTDIDETKKCTNEDFLEYDELLKINKETDEYKN